MTPTEDLRPSMDRWQRNCLLVGGLGIGSLAVGLFLKPQVAFQSYLWAYLFWFGITFGCLGIYLLHNVVGGNWGVVIRRFLESGIRTLPLAFIALLPILFAMYKGFLYIWTNDQYVQSHHLVAVKHGYLTPWFFAVRAVFYFLIWFLWGFRLLRMSGEQDRTGDRDQVIAGRMKRFSAPGLVLFVFTICWAFIDWIMSLEPDWYSTMYPWLSMIGQVLLTFSFLVAVLVLLSKRKPFAGVLNFQHFNDLGNLMLCFTMLWAYMSFGQFLIIWAENLPDEIPWYLKRFSFGWGYLAVFVAIFHFCLPFFLLLMRFIKRNPKFIFWLAVWMIVARLVDLFWVVIPAFRQPNLSIVWTDIVAAIGMGGIWLGFFLWHLKSRPLLPLHDPRLGYQVLESKA
jgi:hypothetical protein